MAKFNVGISRTVWQIVNIDADNLADAWVKAADVVDVHDWDDYKDAESNVDFVEEVEDGTGDE